MCSVKDIISLNLNADTVDYEETDYKWKSYKSITHKVCNLTRRFIKQRWFIVIPALFDLYLVNTRSMLEGWSYFTSNTYNDTLALRWGVIVDHQLLFIFSQPARLVFKSFTLTRLARETNFFLTRALKVLWVLCGFDIAMRGCGLQVPPKLWVEETLLNKVSQEFNNNVIDFLHGATSIAANSPWISFFFFSVD